MSGFQCAQRAAVPSTAPKAFTKTLLPVRLGSDTVSCIPLFPAGCALADCGRCDKDHPCPKGYHCTLNHGEDCPPQFTVCVKGGPDEGGPGASGP